MTYEQAVERAKEQTARGAPSIPCRNPIGWRTVRVPLLTRIEDLRGKHGHHLRGEQVATAKLTEVAVLAIRAIHASGVSMRALARDYGVSRPTIRRVVTREYWKHVA
jgi:helix-turn-helix, Psq domain